jgi:hypothetical protein
MTMMIMMKTPSSTQISLNPLCIYIRLLRSIRIENFLLRHLKDEILYIKKKIKINFHSFFIFYFKSNNDSLVRNSNIVLSSFENGFSIPFFYSQFKLQFYSYLMVRNKCEEKSENEQWQKYS